MTVLSEKLTSLLQERNMTIAQLSQSCKIDRSTLYQYLKGKRVIKSLTQLERITMPLCLTKEEQLEVLEAFDIEQMGIMKYRQYREVEQFFSSLTGAASMVQDIQVNCLYNISADEVNISKVTHGELNVKKVIALFLRKAENKGSFAKIFVSSKYSRILTDLFLAEQYSQLHVSQFFCMDSGQVQSKSNNLDTVRSALCCYFILNHYYACYYYGNVNERFGHSQLLPNTIVTADAVIQFTEDGSEALIHTDTEIVENFKILLEKLEESSHPIVSCKQNLLEEINWEQDYVETKFFQTTYEICSGICSIPFWNRELILHYLHPDVPDYEQLVEMLTSYASRLKIKLKKGQTTLLMNPVFVEEFIQTGVMREYPSYFFKEPLTKADRKYLLEEILASCKEGWYQIRFIENGVFPLDFHWEIMASSETEAFIQYSYDNSFSIFRLTELSCARAIYDYMKILGSGRHAMNGEKSEELVRYWIQKYLSD
ncbi:MAG: helix-turn-helix domain-containing protein [Oliverpabstia sp.]